MSFLGKFKGGYQDLWKAIIRPPRDEYNPKDLGPKEFRLKSKVYKRNDIQLKNKRGLTLECSHFEPAKRVAEQLPCVIYLHGNCSSRIEALQAVEVLLPSNITLFCLDFSGSGLSEGEYISLGWYERDDVEAIIEYLRQTGSVSTIGLWGRSMGAATAIMHADRDPSIGGIVLDSPFSDLRLLAEELVKNHTKIPKLIVSGAMALIRSTIKSKAKFDINDLVPMNHVQAGFVPALFVAGKGDNFIDPHHAKDLYEKYAGDKNIIIVDGDHNSARPSFMMDSVLIFFFNTLLVDQLPKDDGKSKDKERRKSSSKSNEDEKIKENAPLAGGLGFRETYLHHNAQMLGPKHIGNEDDVVHALEDLEECDEEDLRKAIEESLKVNEENAANGNKEEEKEKIERKNSGKEERQGDLTSYVYSQEKIPADVPEEERKRDDQ